MQPAIAAAVMTQQCRAEQEAPAMNTTATESRPAKLSANIPLDLLRQLDQLVQANGPFATRHALLVAAIRVGVAELAVNPSRLIEALDHRTTQR